MKTINYYNHAIAYDVQGQGTPLVFLHGFGENRQMWVDFTPYFEGYKVITIDFPGSGDSAAMEGSIARMAKIVNGVLMAENIEKCVMIGHSMGGYVTLAFAKLYEQKLFGYCLFHSQPNADTVEKKEVRNRGIEFIKKYGNALFFKGLMPKLFAPKFLSGNMHTVDKLIYYGSQMQPKAVIHQLQAMRDRPDNQAVLKNAKVPVCFIIGKLDVAVPAENSLNQTFLPKMSAIHILPKVGHMGMFEAPKKMVNILRNFTEFVINL